MTVKREAKHELAEEVYLDLIGRGKSQQTAVSVRNRLDDFVDVNGVKEKYERADVIRYLASIRERGCGANSIRTYLQYVKIMFNIKEWQFPRIRLEKIDQEEVQRPSFSKEEVENMIVRVVESCPARYAAMFALSTVYGLRANELGTKIKMHFNEMKIEVKAAKGGSHVKHQMPDFLEPLLRHYRPVNGAEMQRVWHRMVAMIQMDFAERTGWHSVRRALATELVAADLSVINIVRFMRWSDQGMTANLGMLAIYAKKDQTRVDAEVLERHPWLETWRMALEDHKEILNEEVRANERGRYIRRKDNQEDE